MGCPCNKNGGSAAKSSAKFTVAQKDGTTKTFTSEADAKLSAAKNGTRVRKL